MKFGFAFPVLSIRFTKEQVTWIKQMAGEDGCNRPGYGRVVRKLLNEAIAARRRAVAPLLPTLKRKGGI